MTCGRDADDVKTVWRVEWHPARATVCLQGLRGAKMSAPGRIRTRDPLLRRQLLCPAELRALEGNCVRRRSRDGHAKVAVCRLDAAPPRKTLAASSPRTPNRRGYRKVPSTQSRSSLASCPIGSPGAPAGQLRVEARPAITSESRLLKHGLERLAPSGWQERSGDSHPLLKTSQGSWFGAGPDGCPGSLRSPAPPARRTS